MIELPFFRFNYMKKKIGKRDGLNMNQNSDLILIPA